MQIARKHLSLSDVQLKMEGDAGIFSGYASMWGGVDSYGDTIEKGAFAETLKAAAPKMFFNHDWTMPIGKWTVMKEDDHGLFVEGELTPGLGLAADVRAAMKHETLDGLSIGGFLKKEDYTETKAGRLIHKWSKLMEVSPVVFPADGAARIDLSSVKSAEFESEIEQIQTIRDFEYFLRDASGFSKGAAQALTARVKALFGSRDAGEQQPEAKHMAEILARIQKIGA
jgi:HK97 family phage prohead protease